MKQSLSIRVITLPLERLCWGRQRIGGGRVASHWRSPLLSLVALIIQVVGVAILMIACSSHYQLTSWAPMVTPSAFLAIHFAAVPVRYARPVGARASETKGPPVEGDQLSVSYAFASLHSRPRREPSVMGLVTCFFMLPRHCVTNYKLPLGVLPRRAGCFNCLKRRFNQLSSWSKLMTLVCQ